MECIVISMLLFTFSAVDAVQILERCLALVLERIRANRLKLSPDKMSILLLGDPSDRLGGSLPRLEGIILSLGDQLWNLGVFLDPALSWDSQIADVSRLSFNQLRLFVQLQHYLDEGP